MDLSLPRGIRDIGPDEYGLHWDVRRAFEEVARSFNFSMMEPAPIEHLSTLRAKSGPDIDSEIYAFRDKGGRDVGLRFDLTVGMTRYVCSRRDLKPPVKLACFGGVWRYDEPQHARYRWFNQWDLEIFGQPAVESDAEVIDASFRIFERLGMRDTFVHVGDRRAVQDFIASLGFAGDRAEELMRALDKAQKRSVQELKLEYVAKGFDEEAVESVFEFGKVRGQPSSVIKRLEEMKLSSAEELASLADQLRSRGVSRVEFDMGVVRGLDYYTGVVFEVLDKSHPELGSLCGGGRYDILPRIFGRPDLSATGSAGGVERAVLSLGGTRRREVLVHVAFAGHEMYSEALKATSSLRSEGIRTDISAASRSLGKQLEEAAGHGAAWVVIVGRKEMKEGVVTLRDMASGKEERLPLSEAAARVRNQAS